MDSGEGFLDVTYTIKSGPGRLSVNLEIRKVIENMARENLLWGAPRIHGESMKLGIDNISERTISYLDFQKIHATIALFKPGL